MSFANYYKLSSFCLIAAGFIAVAATGAVNVIVIALFASALLTAWFFNTARLRQAVPGWIIKGIALACLPACYLDFVWLSHSLLLSALHLLLFAGAVKLLTCDMERDFIYLYLLSCGELLVAATLTTSFSFLFCLVLFVISGISAFILHEMKRSSARALMGGAILPVVVPKKLRDTGFELFAGFPSKGMTVLTLALAVVVMLLALPLFLILPRVSMNIHHPVAGRTEFISGFSERAELGTIGRIKESDVLVMKVKLDAPHAQVPPDLKFRGIALDHFDGRSWSRSSTERNRIASQGGYFKLQQTAQGSDLLMQTIFLEPLATDVVFGSHKVLAVSSDLGRLEKDAQDNIYSQGQRSGVIRYAVVSDVTQPDTRLIDPHPGLPPQEIEACCLQTPQEDARVAETARAVTAAAATTYDKVRALESYLRTSFGYSLELKGTPNHPDPLAMFLFDVRQGHCEYFATAMAVMLRQLGIPSRLVNGFRIGTFNSLPDHWTVRQRDAHSWVEAWLPPYGWIEFDPTPAEPKTSGRAFWKVIENLSDSMDFWWSDDVVNYDIRKQSGLIQSGRAAVQALGLSVQSHLSEASRSFSNRLENRQFIEWIVLRMGIILATVVGLLLLAFLARRPFVFGRRLSHALERAWVRREPKIAAISFYSEALDLLQSRGWKRGSNQTPQEFARGLAHEPFGAALASLTAVYYRLRFGGSADETNLGEVRRLLRDLRATLRR